MAANAIRSDGIPFIYQRTAPPETRPVDIEEAKELFDLGETLFIDSRSRGEYEEGYIEGSINIDSPTPMLIKSALQDIGFDHSLITYCSGIDCHSSDILAEKLIEMGYTDVGVFFGGWPEWQASGYPTGNESGPAPANDIYSSEPVEQDGSTSDPWGSQ